MPLIGAMAMRNFSDILALLTAGRQLSLTGEAQARVVSRALQKRAPFHLNKNSVADALLVELYAEVLKSKAGKEEEYGFVTSNHEDFSAQQGDRRQPHPDITDLFNESTSRYFYRTEGLQAACPATWETNSNKCSMSQTSRRIHGRWPKSWRRNKSSSIASGSKGLFDTQTVGMLAIAADVSTPRRATVSLSSPEAR
jgi:hypothetical protein